MFHDSFHASEGRLRSGRRTVKHGRSVLPSREGFTDPAGHRPGARLFRRQLHGRVDRHYRVLYRPGGSSGWWHRSRSGSDQRLPSAVGTATVAITTPAPMLSSVFKARFHVTGSYLFSDLRAGTYNTGRPGTIRVLLALRPFP
jgi:hypothetical protein